MELLIVTPLLQRQHLAPALRPHPLLTARLPRPLQAQVPHQRHQQQARPPAALASSSIAAAQMHSKNHGVM